LWQIFTRRGGTATLARCNITHLGREADYDHPQNCGNPGATFAPTALSRHFCIRLLWWAQTKP